MASERNRPARILIVDDDEMQLEMMGELLECHDYVVETADGGEKALAIMGGPEGSTIDLIVLDVSMGTPDEGFSVLHTLKTDRAFRLVRHVPVIMASSNRGLDFVVRAIQNQAEDYLEKPVEEEALVARVNASLRKTKVERRYRDLLFSILPQEIADSLIEGEEPPPVYLPSASAMFTDFVGFTESAGALTDRPAELVTELDACFSAFDRLLVKLDRELPSTGRGDMRVRKVSTIGDAYFAVGGIPRPTQTHAIDVVVGALRMSRFIEKRHAQKSASAVAWTMRVGIHTGALTSGVMGSASSGYSYDVFGDTVNVASRMESSSEPGRVNISRATYDLVKDFFSCSPRGEIDVKGKGPMEMFFVDGILEELRNPAFPSDHTAVGSKFKEQYSRLLDA